MALVGNKPSAHGVYADVVRVSVNVLVRRRCSDQKNSSADCKVDQGVTLHKQHWHA
jgi:hypothetical protein